MILFVSIIVFFFSFFIGPVSWAIDIDKTPSRKISLKERPESICSLSTDSNEILDKVLLRMILKINKQKSKKISVSPDLKKYSSFGEEGQSIFCSATVISTNELVTAAHCVRDLPTGDIYLNCPGGIKRKVNRSKIISNKGYQNKKAKDDIAIIRTDSNLGIIPAQMISSYKEFERLKHNDDCAVLGNGRPGQFRNQGTLGAATKKAGDFRLLGGDEFQAFLRTVEIQLKVFPGHEDILYEAAKSAKLGESNVMGEYIGIFDLKTNIQPGDSGGGLFCKDASGASYLVGVTTHISPAKNSKLELFQNIFHQYHWIVDHTILKDPKMDELIQTKIDQNSHYCQVSENCQNILGQKGVDLTTDLVQILTKIQSRSKIVDQIVDQKGLLFLQALTDLKLSYLEFVEKCFGYLKLLGIKETLNLNDFLKNNKFLNNINIK